jgi:phosphonate transport system ATP-binding protein
VIFALRGVGKEFASRGGTVPALHSIDLGVARGEKVALIGASGAGKTTLLRILNATLRATSGDFSFDGKSVVAMSARALRAMRRRIGLVPQHPGLVPTLSVFDNALSGALGRWSLLRTLVASAFPPRDDHDRTIEALRRVGLDDKLRARADELSGGQQQRLAIARVLVQAPEIVLADEPIASLDPTLSAQMMEILVSDHARTVVASMHDVEAALKNFPRLVGISEGRIVFDKATADVDRAEITALYRNERAEDGGGIADHV